MKVWIVTKAWIPNTDIETLEAWNGFQKIIGVYDSEEKSRAVQEELIDGIEPNDVCVEECEVE